MQTISISSVIACHRCPVRFYLNRDTPRRESARYTIAKQISYHLGRTLESTVIWREIQTVTPDIDAGMKAELDTWIQTCAGGAWRKAVDHDVSVASEQYGIHGVLDRVFDDEPYFAIARSSDAPSAGIYATDRLRIACYLICMEESLGLESSGGIVEYIPSGIARLCIPQPRDRRAALRAISIARRVMAGEIPKRPKNAPCNTCDISEICTPGARRIADLL